MKNLTKEEIEELAKALQINELSKEEPECNKTNNEDYFYKTLKYFKENKSEFVDKTFEDIFKFFYYQGVNRKDETQEMPIESVLKLIEDTQFIEYVQNLIENPKENINVEKKEEFIEIYKECDEFDKCASYPDHCEGAKCSIKIPADKFDGLIFK